MSSKSSRNSKEGTSLHDTFRNPTLEDQALARIHRMGQTREVTTVRFFVKDTFEEVSYLIYYVFSSRLANVYLTEGYGSSRVEKRACWYLAKFQRRR